jgi:hypothetical protein
MTWLRSFIRALLFLPSIKVAYYFFSRYAGALSLFAFAELGFSELTFLLPG